MKKIDENYIYLESMYEDSYFPKFLVDKIKNLLEELAEYLEEEPSLEEAQEKLDELTIEINELQDEFYENDSEIETVARDSIAEAIEHILNYYNIEIDIEDALREREW